MKGVEDVEGRVGCDFDRAFAGCCEEGEIWGCGCWDVVGEGRCIGLDWLWVGFEGSIGRSTVS